MRTLAAALLFSSLAFAGDPSRQSVVDGDSAYKQNCTRCHSTVQAYSPRQTATIVMHMRVRANLSEAEARAILHYLNGTTPEPLTQSSAGKVSAVSAH